MALGRGLLRSSKLWNIFDFNDVSNVGCLKNLCFSISVRTAKHWNPRFKWLRSKKYIPIKLPHTKEFKEETSFKNQGIYQRFWKPRPLTITSATEIIDPYQPVVGDGKASFLTKVQSLSSPKEKVKDVTAMRKIKNYDLDFKKDLFVQEAQDIYINAHKVLAKNDPDELSRYATERSVMEMLENVKNKTIRWQFLESLEPPAIVQARTADVLLKTNTFAQITVRFHTKQMLAIYDRFGRLMYGSEILAKDVLEYVVFEKHINNENGKWRLHGKIIPEWRDPQSTTAATRTYRIQEVVEDDEASFNEIDPEADPDIEKEHTASAEVIESDTKPAKL